MWVSPSLLPLSWRTSSIKSEWSVRAHAHTHTQCVGFLHISFSYLDRHRPSRESEGDTYTMWGGSFFSIPSILTDIVHQERMKNTHTQPMGIPSPFPLSWTKIIHNLCGLFLLSSLYFDGEDPSNINQMQTKRIVSWALWFHLSWQTLFVKSKWSMHEYTVN